MLAHIQQKLLVLLVQGTVARHPTNLIRAIARVVDVIPSSKTHWPTISPRLLSNLKYNVVVVAVPVAAAATEVPSF
jgi:hypothetical protein